MSNINIRLTIMNDLSLNCTIVTPALIKKLYLKYNCSKQVAAILRSTSGFEWSMITKLDLSSMNILNIVGLKLVSNLKYLILSHNRIQKIENLDWLTMLEHLDLSLNRIKKIENLDNLTTLKFLSLANNQISTLENLDKNIQLMTIYVDNNNLTEFEQIMQLDCLNHLQYLNVSKNPATSDNACRQVIIERMPNLLYLNNSRILNEERPPVVDQVPKDSLSVVDTNVLENEEVISRAFLYDTDGRNFIKHLYKNDGDGLLLSKWNQTVQEGFDNYVKNMTKNAMILYKTCLKKYGIGVCEMQGWANYYYFFKFKLN